MKFYIRKISDSSVKKSIFSRIFKGRIVISVIVIFIIIFGALFFIASGFRWIGDRDNDSFFNSSLKVDQYGNTNILVMGVAGDLELGGNLTDAILVISINQEHRSISMINFPRDLYVASKVGDRKVNEIYAAARYQSKDELEGLKAIKKSVSDFIDIDLHYSLVLSFQVFEEVVDQLGSIDIFVPVAIVDPFYPAENFQYQTFAIKKGWQSFDSATALKYARSRKTTSDYDRSKRQQNLLIAIKDKALEMKILQDPIKLKNLYKIFRRNIVTDFSLREILELANVVKEVDYNNVVTGILNNSPEKKGGFLYTPARDNLHGQYILLPKSLPETRLYLGLVLQQPEILLEKPQISVLNGTKISGSASKEAERLRRLGFNVIEVSNYETKFPVARTFIRYRESDKIKYSIEFFRDLFQAEAISIETLNPEIQAQIDKLADIQIILGSI